MLSCICFASILKGLGTEIISYRGQSLSARMPH